MFKYKKVQEELFKLISTDSVTDDRLGHSVAISGKRTVIASLLQDKSYVFQDDQEIKIIDGGLNVAMYDETIVTGSTNQVNIYNPGLVLTSSDMFGKFTDLYQDNLKHKPLILDQIAHDLYLALYKANNNHKKEFPSFWNSITKLKLPKFEINKK